jgi:hypothetical protein
MLSNMSISKTLLCAGGLLLAVGGPISMFSASDFAAGIRKNWSSFSAGKASTDQKPSSGSQQPGSEGFAANSNALSPAGDAIGRNASPVERAPLPSLEEVLRFDATVEWVMQRWPRVSTGLQYMQLQGYRVPLMTGTGLSDVAGSLTYYFNAGQRVQRITFRGATGDPTRLVMLLTSRYHFARRLTNDPGVVLYEVVDSSNKPAGTLKIRSARVVKASEPHTRFEVDLAMNRME